MRSRGIGIALLTVLWTTAAGPAAALNVPVAFVVENVTPGASFTAPTALAFLPDGRLLVAEKQGRLWAVAGGVKAPAPMWDGSAEVLSNNDRGLLGIAVDPGFAGNGFLYLLYTVDPDSDGVDDDNDAFGRLTRYTIDAADSNALDPASRTILIGADWRSGPPSGSGSHTVGGLRWGADGSLLVSAGDGAHYFTADPGGLDPDLFGPAKTNPYEDIGAYRAQYLGSLAGKILRVDPATGHGYPSNPHFDGDVASNRSRVYAYGLRNAFRFSVAPGTGSADPADGDPGVLHIGDVGWNLYEELNVAAEPGLNFGWPCREGFQIQAEYDTLMPSHGGCDSVGTNPWNPETATHPRAAWHHADGGQSLPPGAAGNSVTCGVTYTGTRYPQAYRNRLFLADFGRGWIKAAAFDSSWFLAGLIDFGEGMEGPVDLIADPVTGDLHYIAILRGEVRRIRYTGNPENRDPVAVAQASPIAGPAPLAVDYSGAGSWDPDLDPVDTSWTFGDGGGSPDGVAQHVYTAPGAFEAILTAEDPYGGIGRDTVLVIVTATATFPTAAVLDGFDRPDGPLGLPWSGALAGLAVEESTLVSQAVEAWAVRSDGPFAPTQEAFVTLAAPASTVTAVDLLLKVRAADPDSGHLRIHYDGVQEEFWFISYAPFQGWSVIGDPVNLPLGPGDRFGARAYANGLLDLYVNGALVKSVTAGGWPFHGAPGTIGLAVTDGAGGAWDDFGGGNTVLDPNTPPAAAIDRPLPGLFYGDQDTIRLEASGSDAEDPPDSLDYRWEVDLHHNNHVHPSIFTSTLPATFFLAENHDDGTGVFHTVRLIVTDTGGMSDTASVPIHPDVDVAAGTPWSDPLAPGTLEPALYGMTITNAGRMPSPAVRWQIVLDLSEIASGDTVVPAGDSVQVSALVPPGAAPGWHTLTAIVDAQGEVHEPDETDNSASVPLLVVEGGGTSGAPGPSRPAFAVGAPRPNPSRGGAAIDVATAEPALLRLDVFDVLGRRVHGGSGVAAGAGRHVLVWDGRREDGRPAAAGVYRLVVRAGPRRAVRSLVLLGP